MSYAGLAGVDLFGGGGGGSAAVAAPEVVVSMATAPTAPPTECHGCGRAIAVDAPMAVFPRERGATYHVHGCLAQYRPEALAAATCTEEPDTDMAALVAMATAEELQPPMYMSVRLETRRQQILRDRLERINCEDRVAELDREKTLCIIAHVRNMNTVTAALRIAWDKSMVITPEWCRRNDNPSRSLLTLGWLVDSARLTVRELYRYTPFQTWEQLRSGGLTTQHLDRLDLLDLITLYGNSEAGDIFGLDLHALEGLLSLQQLIVNTRLSQQLLLALRVTVPYLMQPANRKLFAAWLISSSNPFKRLDPWVSLGLNDPEMLITLGVRPAEVGWTRDDIMRLLRPSARQQKRLGIAAAAAAAPAPVPTTTKTTTKSYFTT
jgi:hypothetical protein